MRSFQAANPTHQTAEAIRHFLLWAVSPEGGNAPKYLNSVGFTPLPTFIRALSEHQIDRIKWSSILSCKFQL